MASADGVKWVRISSVALAITTAAISLTAALFSVSIRRRRSTALASRVRELEEKVAAERRGRVRAQQTLRQALARQSSHGSSVPSYPMVPIGTVQSCFSTRNGTPRQPALVPLSRACLVFDPSRVPSQAIEGLADYSHCWILYVFHLNTNLDKMWKLPSRSKFKAKVKVPLLKGGKMGVLATRSPHRPCPIGLSVAKVEAVDGHAVLLSGVDLVDGTPVLDIKPYLPYSDSIEVATVPKWLKTENTLAVASVSFSTDFPSSLSSCWAIAEKQSLYASTEEFQSLIKQVLSWDIRSLVQRKRPHQSNFQNGSNGDLNIVEVEVDDDDGEESDKASNGEMPSQSLTDITYHLILEGLDISYRLDQNLNVTVEKATVLSSVKNLKKDRCNYLRWKDKLVPQK